MGYAPDGRGRFVNPDAQERVYAPAGNGRRGVGRMEVAPNMFEAVAAFPGAWEWKEPTRERVALRGGGAVG